MNHLTQVFLYELRRNFRRKGYLFTTFLLPLILFALGAILPQLLSSLSSSERSRDPAQVNLPSELMGQITHAGYVDFTGRFTDPGELAGALIRYPDEASAQAALSAGDIDVYFVIPQNYFETGDVTQVMPRLNVSMVNGELALRLILNHIGAEADPQVMARLQNPSNLREVDLVQASANDGRGVEQSFDTRFAVVYVFALILLFSLFMTNGYLLQTVIEEKETRLIEILVATVRPFQLLAGKILALGLLGIIQVAVWGGIFIFLTWLGARETLAALLPILSMLGDLYIPVQIIPLLLVYYVLGYLLLAALFGVVGALSNSMREGPQYAAIFTLPAAIPLWFTTLFATQPNGTLAVVLSLFPMTAPLAMAQRLAVTTVPTIEIIASIAILALSVVGALWLAGRMFRIGTLLSGQMPKLRDIPKLLRA
jgi:ABC-2 type transport system permease protein